MRTKNAVAVKCVLILMFLLLRTGCAKCVKSHCMHLSHSSFVICELLENSFIFVPILRAIVRSVRAILLYL